MASHQSPPRAAAESAHAERLELLRRQVFVAITRARDGVWIGWLGQPAGLFSGLASAAAAGAP